MPTPIPLPPSSHAKPVDSFQAARELENELQRLLKGEVRFDASSRALYATDGSNYRQIPIGLVIPRDSEDVMTAVAACRKYGAPVLARGGGTSLAGQCCNVAVVLDFSKYMNRILEVDPASRTARVQPGVVLDVLRNQAETHRLTFAPDPSTHSRCTLGGMIGNNSCGTHSLLGGKTVDNVEELTILLYDGTVMTVGPTPDDELESIIREGGRRGEIYGRLRSIRDRYGDRIRARFPRIPRRVSGYNLDELLPEQGFHVARSLVGTEGTCAIVLEAKVRLVQSPQKRVLVGLGYADGFVAADHVTDILEFKPIGLEGFEGRIIENLRKKKSHNLDLLPQGGGYLIAEFGADDVDEVNRVATELVSRLKQLPDAPNIRIYSQSEAQQVWKIREAGPRGILFQPNTPHKWEGWDDSAVAPEKLGGYLRDLRKLLDEYNYDTAFYGHYGHGCMHMQISFDLESEPGIRNFAEFIDRAADLVIGYGGSLSGEHGDGQARSALLPKMYGPEIMEAFGEFKAAWDPDNRMNPRIIVNAHPISEDLRMGADYKPLESPTHFQFPDDNGSFAKATLRCIGTGACRKRDTGVMCPSYMATMEEEHSTRGRAHMLFEMFQNELVQDGWRNESVKRALDLCLSCKACKSECPTNVDVATYKAEFLSHYYEGRRHPLYEYAFGRIDRWAQLASTAPALANFLSTAPGVQQIMRAVLRLAPERRVPRFSSFTFQQWARNNGIADVAESAGRAPTQQQGPAQDVILWPDTFNNHFRSETGRAAAQVLAQAGFRVRVPRRHLCCGRPLYDFGMIDMAKQYLRTVMDALRGPIEAGVPVVVLEPSCASVFRDELRGLFPKDALATRLHGQTYLLSEFLERRAPGYEPPRLERKVLLHGHCHHKALMKMNDEESLLRKMGAEIETPDAGCCGMAGPFGFERDKFAVSQAIGERVLLPAVRAASADTLIVSDGFSCREQIRQAAGREAIHLAEALQMALREESRDAAARTGPLPARSAHAD